MACRAKRSRLIDELIRISECGDAVARTYLDAFLSINSDRSGSNPALSHAEHQRSAPGDRQAHDTTSELCREPAHPQTHRGGLQLYQGVGGLRQTSWSQDRLDLVQFVGFGDRREAHDLPRLLGNT
jgi:hypothetical protein